MAELLAIGKDLKNLALQPTLNADGSASLKMAGSGYKPELRLNKAETAAVVKALSVPPAPPVETPPVPPLPVEPPKTGVIIGTNDWSGWQEAPAKAMLAAGIKSGRLEGTGELSKALGYGADPKKMLIIVGNTSNGSRLSTVNKSSQTAEVLREAEACAAKGVELLEFMNEPYLKGASHNNEGATYAALYLSALAAIKAKGLNVRLLASLDCELRWVEAFPAELWQKVQGLTIHPYGVLTWNFGWAGYLKCLEYAARKGANVGWYVTEDGVELNVAELPVLSTRPSELIGAAYERAKAALDVNVTAYFAATYPGFSVATEAERQALVKSKYETYIASKVAGGCKGIYYYQSHNDSTGKFGFMDNTNKPLPLMGTIAAFA